MSFAKNVGKNVDKIIIKNLSGKYSQKLLDHAKLSATDTFKTSSKKSFKKQQKQPVILLVIRLPIELQKFQKNHNKLTQRKLQMRLIKKKSKEYLYIYIYIYIYILCIYIFIYIYILYIYIYYAHIYLYIYYIYIYIYIYIIYICI